MSAAPSPMSARRARPRVAGPLDVCRSRGAILVHTAAMLVGLTAFSAFVVDYGIMWTARRQIQNAADAAALAAANSLAFDIPNGFAGAQQRATRAAMDAASQNLVWGQAPVVEGGTISFPSCPAGAIGSGPCVRVDAYRNQAHGNPLDTIFAKLVGVDEQGVQATATAQVLWGESSTCVRPMAVPDKWQELNEGTVWANARTFSRYNAGGGLISNPDYYQAPGGGSFASPNGTGFSRDDNGASRRDYGRGLAWGPALPAPPGGGYFRLGVNPEAFVPVSIGGVGPAAFLTAMTQCVSDRLGPGSVLAVETSDVNNATIQAYNELYALDPVATWDPSQNGGRGGIRGGCMATSSCLDATNNPTNVSARLIAIPAFNPDLYDASSLNTTVTVTRILGFFIEALETPANRIRGHITVYPVLPSSTMTADPRSSFLASVTLVR